MARPMPPVSPCAPWLCSGTSTPTELARAATTRRGALRSTTSMASSITPTGSTTCSSPPPWEVENYEPRNPIESASPLWLSQEAIDAWTPQQTGKRGGQPVYSDTAIATALSLRLLLHLPLRQTEGF